MKQSLRMAATHSAFNPVIQFIVAIAMGLLIFLGLQSAVLDEMSSGSFVAFFTAAGMLMKPIRQLSSVLGTIQKGLAAAQDIFKQLDETPELDNGIHEVERVSGEVVFKNISLSYGKDQPMVLKNINFSIKPGQSVALVGSSGSGKSSLINLIPRFYNPSEGSVTIDGVDVHDYKLLNLRQQIALVNQQVILFNDTVYKNIAYGALQGCQPSQVDKAADVANASEFIRDMSHGMQTLVGDNGVMLSGGQRQRIAIARAILKDAPILILDEATSALDNESERLIQGALEKVMHGRTTFVIAHRLSTVEKADLILVMEHGEIIESGNHASLLAAGGRYATLHSNKFND